MSTLNLIEEAFKGFENEESESSTERKLIGIWVPVDYWKKYDEIQSRKNKKLSKVLRFLVMKAIDYAYRLF